MIPPITRASIPQRPLTFAGINRSSIVHDEATDSYTQHDHSSWLFRDPHVTQYFPTILRHRFPTGCDVQVYGSSDGSEVYSLLLIMNQAFGGKADALKPYTMTGYDISPERVRLAQQGIIGMALPEKQAFDTILKQPVDRFFTPLPASTDVPDAGHSDLLDLHCQSPSIRHLTSREFAKQFYTYYQVKPELHQQARFEVGDIRERAKHPFTKPTMVFLKHVLGYLEPEDRKAVVENLFKNLPQGSMVVISEEEGKGPMRGGFNHIGFRTLNIPTLPELSGTYWMKP